MYAVDVYMVSLDNIIYVVGQNATEKEPICSDKLREIVFDTADNKKTTGLRINSIVLRYRHFFIVTSKKYGNTYHHCYSLNSLGKKYYEKIKDIYDPVTNTRLIENRRLSPELRKVVTI